MKKSILTFLLAFTASIIGYSQVTFSGKVVDENNMPLPGASVVVKGSTTGVATDFDGSFEIQLPSANETLLVSYIGYLTKEFITSGQSTGTIVLQPDSQKLNEVVVTALGIKKDKKRLGYSVEEVQGELTKARSSNVVSQLSGKISGLIVANSAEYFASPNLVMRGKKPLVVVDGVPLGTDTWNISPDDIESITVLKGANAGALYGSDGANGAVQITTKRGSGAGKGFVIEWNNSSMVQAGFNAVPTVQHSYGPGSYGKYAFVDGRGGGINDADYDQWGPKFEGQLIPQYDSPLDGEGNRVPTPWLARGKDNFKNFIEQGLLETNNLTAANIFDKGNVRFSASHTYQKGINPNTKLNIFTYNLSGVYNFSEKTSVNGFANFNFQHSPNNPNVDYGPNSYIYNMLIWGGSDWDVRDLRNYWQEGKEGLQQINFEYTRYNNPYFMAYEWLRGYQKNSYTGQLNFTHKFTDEFNVVLRTNIATNNLFRNEKFPYSATTYGREKAQGDYKERYDYAMKSYSDLMFNYENNFGDIGVRALVGTNLDIDKARYSYARTNYLIVPGLYTLSNSQSPVQPVSYRTHYENYSGYFSTDLSYKDYVTLGITGRYQKDSRLPKANNTFFYPSVSLSTVLSSIFDLPETIDFLKLRGSYAKVGSALSNDLGIANNNIDYLAKSDIYSNQNTYQTGEPYTIDGTVYNWAYVNSVLANPNLKPAFNSSTEVGLETNLLKNAIGLSATYYENKNGPRIFNLNYSKATGYDGQKANGITTRTKGWEIALDLNPVRTENFRWHVNLNWGTFKEYLEKVYTAEDGTEVTNLDRVKVGERIDQYWIRDFMRTPDGQLIVGDDGKPIVDTYYSKIGYANPDWAAGITNNISYKNVSLDFTFDGRYGGKILNYVNKKLWQSGRHPDSDTPERANDVQEIKSYVTDGVVVTGGELTRDGEGNVISDTRTYAQNTTKMYYQDYAKSYHGNDAANIIDKTFAKLREVTLSYNLPSSAFKNMGIDKMSISLVGRNLWYISKHKNIDLDQFVSEGSSPLQSPTVKSYGINLNVKF